MDPIDGQVPIIYRYPCKITFAFQRGIRNKMMLLTIASSKNVSL